MSEKIISALPLRDIVMFPSMVAPLFVGRPCSVRSVQDQKEQDQRVLVVTQKDPAVDDPVFSDIYHIGVVSRILQLLRLPDGTVKVLVEGEKRVKIRDFFVEAGTYKALVEDIEDERVSDEKTEALMRAAMNMFDQYSKLNRKITPEIISNLTLISDSIRIADSIAIHVPFKISDKQSLLESKDINESLTKMIGLLESEMGVLNAEKKIRSRVKKQLEKSQKEFYLNEQLKAIQEELGKSPEARDEILELEKRIATSKMSKEAKEKAANELKKFKMMNPMSAEAGIIRNYLEWMVDIPWLKRTPVKKDLGFAEKVLDLDHYGLEKVKERILEYLAVQQRVKKVGGSILCLVGPPGVGKTSLAKSIAKATGRNFVKVALGGVRDEAEIRGHRRTYIGAMPGKIIQSMKKAKSSNPVFLLDEIDKISSDYRGDPSSALLEVLDPEQNKQFNDHYLEVDYDLSEVLFFATANSTNMPRPLLDRMEVIRISGYTEEEKLEIAKRHLFDKQLSANGLKKDELKIDDEAVLEIIRYYTKEAGVRNLEREIAKISRKAVKEITLSKTPARKIIITPKNLQKYLGVKKFAFGEAEKEDMIGAATGLAYTEMGGDLLTIEAVKMPGKGKFTITGKLGEVMQESVQAASSYVRSKSVTYGIAPPIYQKIDIHIHVPEGATPKDGPSAGIAISTAIISLLTGIPVKKSVAMTGEVTLRGRVLAIGGLKEKLLAALRGGIKTVIIPKDNLKDLEDMPAIIKKKLQIVAVSTVDEVLECALCDSPKPIEWVDIENISQNEEESDISLRKH